jgi:D-lactate dehydrogenase
MRAIAYSVRGFERIAFDDANKAHLHQLTYVAAPLNQTTIRLAEGYEALIPSLNDPLDGAMLQLLAKCGVSLIALRSAGYNNLDIAAAERLRMKAVYVPRYTPHAAAEHVFALTLALLRNIPRAWQRVRDLNFDVEGLVGTQLEGRTFGVIGLGKIGRVVAGIAKGFGCEVVASDAQASPESAPCPLLTLEDCFLRAMLSLCMRH